jgi:hypothetical protein
MLSNQLSKVATRTVSKAAKERSEESQRRSEAGANMYNKSIRASKRYKTSGKNLWLAQSRNWTRGIALTF